MLEERLGALFDRFGVDELKDLHSMIVDRTERALIRQVLARTKGSQVKAAAILGINRNTLRRKLAP
jgi:two-component system nitrogen regulation response regulator GlnG